jgi:Spy/CpxP family protein refolding chaperone
MKKNILQAVLAAALAASFLGAQTSTPTAPATSDNVADLVKRLTKLLDLTSTQQASATTYFTTEQGTLTTVAASMKTERSALQTAVLKNDTAGISAAATQIGDLTTQRVSAVATADASFYAILTPEQQEKLKTLKRLGLGGLDGRKPRD